MKEFTITDNDAGQRLDRFVTKVVPALPKSLIQKYIRIKRIKVGGKQAQRDYRLIKNDVVQMYINDEHFERYSDRQSNTAYMKNVSTTLDIVYQDENLMVLNKPAGLLCHSDGSVYTDTLIQRVQAYLYKNGQWHPHDSNSFTPALCNRIDRNTSGLVIAAKNAVSLRILCDKIKTGEIDKYYLALVCGVPEKKSAVLEGYIFKDAVKNRVFVKKTFTPGAKKAITEYKTLETIRVNHDLTLSLLECHLITGRTHQIRAQLATAGNPILGDGKYGYGEVNRTVGQTKQALCSYKLVFAFKNNEGMLSYLRDKIIMIDTEKAKKQLTTKSL